MELHVDLLSDQRPHAVLAQLQLLRRHTGRLPVIFTIRSKGQCGAFADDPVAMFDLLKWGLRGGVEYLDIEANWGARMIGLAKAHYPATVLMGSYHVVGKKTTEAQARKLYKRCYHRGQVDAVKVVTTAIEHQDSYRVHQAAESLALPVPHIGLCLTPTGSLSRVLNMRFTPVTHAKLPSVAAPGQLTSEAIMRLRQDLGMLQPKQFYLFGAPISASPSPAMHNSGFQHCHLSHSYALCESEGTEAMAAALRSPDFGGGSVTIPHKQNVLQFLDQISPAAEKIGAVNTVIVQVDPETGKPVLLGDNTDWLGILRPIKARLAAKGVQHKKGGVALILVIYNRTLEKAQELAWRFNGCAVSQLDPETFRDACGKWAPDVVISTVPGTATFTLPQHMLEAKPVVFDAAYKPARTALLDQAIKAGCPYVQGAEMLVEQGVEQFQLWTKRHAPKDVMAAAVYGSVEKL
ncbi:type I 3-dehydroquinase-domain-containing protein [Tribonema minus]|uniref:Type I 3-dehydroquinase-domain-containing protein n=1 Tax=Tribonema minus TaxID=303371 RepID=A0A836CDF8_9STRA|nr:type I 3-dehydroquinase-domain-containing protein [Tribonema minus]